MTHLLKVVAVTAVGYFLAGLLGQLFAVPPGYATVIWLASGVAIAACLLFGYRSVLGVFLGSSLVNIAIGYSNSGQIHLLVPVLIALGSSVQTIFSYWLVRRFIGQKLEFFNIRHVSLFVILAGPVGCLVSASVGTSVLYGFSILPAEQVSLNWLSWWLGDSVGVIVLVPWLAVAFRKRFDLYYDHPGRVVSALVIVAVTTLLLSLFIAYFEFKKQHQAFQADAELDATLLSERIKNSVDILYGLIGYVRGSSEVSPSEFADYTENVMSRDRSIKALSLNHVVSRSELQSYERSMQALYKDPFEVTQRDNQGNLVSVTERERYVPVGIIYPLEPNRKALGFDVYSERSRREAIDQAIKLNEAYPTPGITLVQGSYAVLTFLPIYHKDNLEAMATALFEIDDLALRVFGRSHVPNTQIYLVDRRPEEEPYILASNNNAMMEGPELFEGLANGRFPSLARTVIPIGAHRWELIHLSNSYFIEQPWGTHFALVGGLFVAGLLGWMLSLVFSHAAQVERQVAARTKELSEVNLALRESGDKLRQATQEAQEANLAKSRFLANMSHEIRTPLNGMLGGLSLLQSKPLSSEQKKLVELAHQSGDALLDLVNDILDLSKIEAGELELESQYFDLQDLLEDMVSVMTIKAKEKGIVLMMPESLLPDMEVYGDRLRVRQILLNLVGNAIKFTNAEGRVTLRTEVLSMSEGAATLKVWVMDTGIGISESLQERLFQRFRQADTSTTRRYGGTGLGLAISRELVEAMKGEIGVESQLGEGAKFWFSIPFTYKNKSDFGLTDKLSEQLQRTYLVGQPAGDTAYAKAIFKALDKPLVELSSWQELPQPVAKDDMILLDDSAFTQANEESIAVLQRQIIVLSEQDSDLERLDKIGAASVYKPIHRKVLLSSIEHLFNQGEPQTVGDVNASDAVKDTMNAHILLVEDNLTNQIVAKGMLKLLGVTVDVAVNGEEALERLTKEHFDLIFMDCQMPVMDGYEATQAIRGLGSDSATPNDVPIVALSANAMKGDEQVCFDAGMNDHIAKPVTQQRLKEALEQWLLIRSK